MSGQGLHQLKNTSQKLIKVRDGLLDPHEFTAVRDSLISEESLMPWYFSEGIDYGPEEKNFMFFHVFYESNQPTSDRYQSVIPVCRKLSTNNLSLHQIKANIYTRTSTIEKHRFHSDFEPENEAARHWMVGIFYLNSNDGYTEFENGEIVESKANRLVVFPGYLSHRGTTCTDQKIRAVINFRYYGW